METPEPLEIGSHDLATARRRLDELRRDSLPVLEGDTLAGAVTRQGIAEAEQRGETALENALHRNVPTAEPDTRLNTLYAACSSGMPVAITDTDGNLVGVVRPEAVFNLLANETKTMYDYTFKRPCMNIFKLVSEKILGLTSIHH